MTVSRLHRPIQSAVRTALAIAVASSSLTVLAQDAPRRGSNAALMEEVLVTARKREEPSQDVPLAITA